MSDSSAAQPGFITLFGADESQADTAHAPQSETEERYANVRAHVELGIRIYGNRAVFGQAIGTTSGSVGNWLNGKMPRGAMRIKIAAALGIGPDALMHEPLPDLIARAEASTAPKRTRKHRDTEKAISSDAEENADSSEVAVPHREEVPGEQAAEAPAADIPPEEPVPEVTAEQAAEEKREGDGAEDLSSDESAEQKAEEPLADEAAPEPTAECEEAAQPLEASAEEFVQGTEDNPEEGVTSDEEEGSEEGRAEPLPSPLPFPGTQDALNAFGERLSAYLTEKGIRPRSGRLFDGQIPEQRVRSFILGSAVPDLIDLRVFAGVFDVSVNALRCEVFLPSKALRDRDEFEPTVAACGLFPTVDVEPSVETSQEAENPEDELLSQEADETEHAAVRVEHMIFDLSPDGQLNQLAACEFKNGILADMVKKQKKELCLFTVPNNELAPAFSAGEVVVVDISFEGEKDCWDIGSPGWYLVNTYGTPQLRHLILNEGKIIAMGAAGDRESFDSIDVCGAVVARISISAV